MLLYDLEITKILELVLYMKQPFFIVIEMWSINDNILLSKHFVQVIKLKDQKIAWVLSDHLEHIQLIVIEITLSNYNLDSMDKLIQ